MKKFFGFITIMLLITILPSFSYAGYDHDFSKRSVSTLDVFTPDFSGDVRLRYKGINDYSDSESYRARLNIGFPINENVDMELGLSSGDRIINDNQNYDNPDNIVDLANVRYYNDNFMLTAGKTFVPFYKKSELFWDDDSRTEGITLSTNIGDDQSSIFATIGHYNDLMNGGQIGVMSGDSDYKLTCGVGYYDYLNDSNNVDDIDLSLKEAFITIDGKLILPITIFGNYGWTDSENNAWLAGIELGKCDNDKPGTFQLAYNYRDVENMNVNYGLSDYDFQYLDKGNEIKANLQLMKNIRGKINYITKQFDSDYVIKTDIVLYF